MSAEAPTIDAPPPGEELAFDFDGRPTIWDRVLPNTFALGAHVDDAAVGLAWGLQMRSPSGRLTTDLHELDVHENWRRQGIGSAIVSGAMTIARRNGSTKFWLSTGGHNEMAQALYGSLGKDRKPLGDVNYWWDLD